MIKTGCSFGKGKTLEAIRSMISKCKGGRTVELTKHKDFSAMKIILLNYTLNILYMSAYHYIFIHNYIK